MERLEEQGVSGGCGRVCSLAEGLERFSEKTPVGQNSDKSEGVNPENIWGRSSLGGGRSKCKGPEVGPCLA